MRIFGYFLLGLKLQVVIYVCVQTTELLCVKDYRTKKEFVKS